MIRPSRSVVTSQELSRTKTVERKAVIENEFEIDPRDDVDEDAARPKLHEPDHAPGRPSGIARPGRWHRVVGAVDETSQENSAAVGLPRIPMMKALSSRKCRAARPIPVASRRSRHRLLVA